MAKKPASSGRYKGSSISRYVSFVMLCVTIVVCGFFFYNVIKGFILPLFLASLLAVIFRPFHAWVSARVKNRPTIAAALSTGAIMFAVLVPLAGLVVLGVYEANQVVRSRGIYIDKLEDVRKSFGLQKPFAERLDAIETEIRNLDDAFSESSNADAPTLESLVDQAREAIHEQLLLLKRDATVALIDQVSDLSQPGENLNGFVASNPTLDQIEAFTQGDAERRLNFESYVLREKLGAELAGRIDLPEVNDTDSPTAEKSSLKYVTTKAVNSGEGGFMELVEAFERELNEIPTTKSVGKEVTLTTLQLHREFSDAQFFYQKLQTELLGGPIWSLGMEMVNPSKDQIDDMVSKLFSGGVTRWLPSITNTATSLITGLLVGLGIMSVALFYFFMDGPKMINAFMHLSPLDDSHELELLQEFDKVSRAVVLATLLSAVAQGILGGIGYKLVGLESVFLLTLLTAVLALIPFVGAAAVWVPCCLYLAFFKEMPFPDEPRTWMYARAGFLAVYGFLVVSMADNFIKPWVLKGQSKLHPLLALLSVLGGVQALGPIGILVGPMVVAFLQVLLTILQREITSLDAELTKSERG